jgi:hypothetical protein
LSCGLHGETGHLISGPDELEHFGIAFNEDELHKLGDEGWSLKSQPAAVKGDGAARQRVRQALNKLAGTVTGAVSGARYQC